MSNHFRYFKSPPQVIRLVVMYYTRFPLSLRNVEDILFDRGIDISYETVRFWWNRFGLVFASEIRKKQLKHSARRYLWRAVNHEGTVLDAVVTKKRDRKAALKLLKKLM
jgi:putative transposase